MSTRAMMEHSYSIYGDITAKHLADNHQNMNTPYDPNQLFENLVDQIDEATELVDAVDAPYTVPQIASIGYNLIHQTDIFIFECQTWDEKSMPDKTWNTFSIFYSFTQGVATVEHGHTVNWLL